MRHRVLTLHSPEVLTRVVELEHVGLQLTLDALADIDAGRVAAHDEMATWAIGLPPKPVRRRPWFPSSERLMAALHDIGES